jgi:hypothetical protein
MAPESPKAPEQGAERGKGGFGQHAERYRERWAASHPGARPREGEQPDAAQPDAPQPDAPQPEPAADGDAPDADPGPGRTR